MIDQSSIPGGVKHTLDATGGIAIVGVLLNVLPAITAMLVLVWTIFRLLDTRVTKALLFKWFGFDLEAWLTINRAGKPDADD